jgi:very-short-patch-repair endonuclease/Cdc6-like AAA superfamily ATPase
LRSIAYDAQSFESEQGVNILYLALGFLKWFELQDASKPRYAPLLLVPVTLTRSSARERFTVAYSGEELATNLSLQQRLADDGIALPDIPDADDLSPNAYTKAVADSVAGVTGWEVLPDAIVLGFFSFAKLMMYRDLDPTLWPPAAALNEHEIVAGLLGEGFRGDGEALIGEDARVDEVIDISTAGHVVDADSSQMLAIEDVKAGRNLVIQGPPGTGKSQTITNLIASAIRSDKRVLFVAEKMAALGVVRANLERIGLAQACLELHSHKAKKKTVLDDLAQTYQLELARNGRGGASSADLRAARDKLNAHVARIHTPLQPSTFTPFEVFAKLARLQGSGVHAPDFRLDEANSWERRGVDERHRRIVGLADHINLMGVPARHPWRGVGVDAMLPQDVERIAVRAAELESQLATIAERSKEVLGRALLPSQTLGDVERALPFATVAAAAPRLDVAAMGSPVWESQREAIAKVVEAGWRFSQARTRLQNVFTEEAWNTDVGNIIRVLDQHAHSWLRWMKGEYRTAVRHLRALGREALPKSVSERLTVLRLLRTGQSNRQRIAESHVLGEAAFGELWHGENSDWAALHAIDSWEAESQHEALPLGWRTRLVALAPLAEWACDVVALHETIAAATSGMQVLLNDLKFDSQGEFGTDDTLSIGIDLIRDRLTGFSVNAARLQEWSVWRLWSREARNVGLSVIVDGLYDGRLDAGIAGNVFLYASFEAMARQVFSQYPELALFEGRSHERLLADFQSLDREVLRLARAEIQVRHVEQMPRGNRDVGEVGTLAREWQKQRRHLPLRQLIKKAGRAIQMIKPVWMMSPMSLAQFVAPGAVMFDLVLMDEASQIRPVEALGAIGRAKQVVVVGDDKQLPPTSFFDRVSAGENEVDDEEEFEAADIESILGLCSAQGIPDRMLRWHYRSQHESLIAVSNLEFYRKLYIVPSAEVEDLGLRFTKVKGVYDRGKTATNRIEARAVAEAVISHARRYRSAARFPHGMSLGVGTFSVAQRDAILDELERLWRENPDLAPFFGLDQPEPFFVKNLESIQGDERDVVMISVGYGPDSDGFTAMSFGPLTTQGGERRLNVLISRARRRCEVFSSISAGDIDLGRSQGSGVRVLKTFLQYAESGFLDRADVPERPVDSDFEEDVGGALARLGYEVQHQVGVAGFFVDMAIKDPQRPGRFLLGIECDGATYHSSRSARDRDRLREEVLISRGWRIHRIWSTDWFKRRDAELTRAIAAMEAARSNAPTVPIAEEREEPVVDNPVVVRANGANGTYGQEPAPASIPYVEASFRVEVTGELHTMRRLDAIGILKNIVEVEGPIHLEEIGRRFATVCGKDRAGGRIQAAVQEHLRFAEKAGWLHRAGSFYSLAPLEQCQPRDRSSCSSLTLKSAEMLPPAEIRTGLRTVVSEHVGVEPTAAIVEVARMLGLRRTGSEIKDAIEQQLRAMLGEGVLRIEHDNRIYLPS